MAQPPTGGAGSSGVNPDNDLEWSRRNLGIDLGDGELLPVAVCHPAIVPRNPTWN